MRPKQKGLAARYIVTNTKSDQSDTGGLRKESGGEGEGSVVNTTKLQQLVQFNPPETSGYTKHKVYSWKDSKESYQNKAKSVRTLLWWNKRIATKAIVIHFLKPLLLESLDDFKERRTKIFRYLCEHGIEAFAIIEPTRMKAKIGKVAYKVHFHILTDDPRSKKELRALFNEACERSSLFWGSGNRLVRGKDFRVDCKEDPNGFGVEYYLKYGAKWKHRALQFHKEVRLHKTYTIGKWFKDENDEKKKIADMRKEIKAYMKAKENAEAEP